MDIRLWPLANQIAGVEHMAVQLRAICSLGDEVVDSAGYDFVNRASRNYTAKGWVRNRLEKKFPYLTGWIVDESGTRLDDFESITRAWYRYELIWSDPLQISLSGKDPSGFDLFVPFFQQIGADVKPVSKRFLRKSWVMNITTPPVILWGFEYEKVKEYLSRAGDANDVNLELSREKSKSVLLSECLVFEYFLEALSKVTDISPERDSEYLGDRSEKVGRKFIANYNRRRVENLCKALKNGGRGVTLGREILEQLDQGCLVQSTYERLSRWVNPERPEPFAQPIAAEISMLLFGKEIERTQ